MILYLSTTTPWRSDYCTEDGRIVYKVNSPRNTWGGAKDIRITTLGSSATYSTLAQIDYYGESFFGEQSTITVGGTTLPAKAVLRKDGWAIFGYGDRLFQGPDGQIYRWTMDSTKCRLFKKDNDGTLVATYHHESLGILSAARPASLEISASGEQIVD
ncbi:hypothetical protein CPB83DRAFT_849696 [Crepidotus variabilis]|uniref:DUF6593 domain-containing protein n=1 Tax=Crepidotus variabilis TaxID=179855 RepID=A0A9P6JSF6_9AGAR|nr:hypothetical protein CPB83DRAFT_849696 [Crepidotus variabilis]